MNLQNSQVKFSTSLSKAAINFNPSIRMYEHEQDWFLLLCLFIDVLKDEGM